jgi:hypothetical protein
MEQFFELKGECCETMFFMVLFFLGKPLVDCLIILKFATILPIS